MLSTARLNAVVDTGSTRRRGRLAVAALYDELALAPKPGLVSFVDSGSHDDMDARTFMRSLFALRGYFVDVGLAGLDAVRFDVLEQLGRTAEDRMLQATGGVNTHRGAIFLLGLLCAAAGRLAGQGRALDATGIRASILDGWGAELRSRVDGNAASKGRTAARRHGLRAAGEEAALGFPTLFEHAMPALRFARQAGLDDRRARLHVLFTTIAVLDDTTIAHRGGIEGLRFARRSAMEFLQRGGGAAPDAVEAAQAIHRDFVARRLSPGGSADILAAACWIERVCREP